MLRKALQQSFQRTTLVQPLVANRLFSIHATQRQESGTLKPTSGKSSLLFSHFLCLLTFFPIDSLGFDAKAVKDFHRPIYLDMQATSPTDPRVLDAMLPYMTELYGNPHSRTHKYGWETEKAVEKAREVL